MADTTNTAEILITADASGVEAGLRQATTAAERAERQITGGANNSARSQGNLIAAIQRTTAQMESGGRAGSRYFEILAQQRGVDPRALEPYLRQLRAVEQAQTRVGQSAAQTSNAMRQLPAQMTDVLVSLQGGQSPLTVLLQQGGQVTDSFGGVGNAIRNVGSHILGLLNPVTLATAAVAGLTYAYYAGSQEARAYNLAIATTGNAAGTSAALMAEAAVQTSEFIGSQSNAAKVLASMVATGQISGAVMVDLSVAAIKAQRDLGREVSTTVEEYAALGKDPVKALADLIGKYHHLSGATYAQVKALQDEGRTVEAVTLAQKAHADGIHSQSARVVENLGYIESAWRGISKGVSEAAGSVKDWFLNLGRDDTMADLTASAAKIQRNIDDANARNDTWGARKQQALLDVINGQITAMQKKLGLSQQEADVEARNARAAQLRIEITNGLDSLLSREQLRTRDIAAARAKAAEAGLSQAETEQLLAVVRKKYADVDEAAQKKREAAAKAAAEALKKEAGLLAELAGLTPSFAEDWDRLSKAYAKGALSLDQLTQKQAELLAKQPGIKKANDEQIKAQAESDKLYEQGIKTAEQYRDSLLEQLTTQRQANDVIGLSTVATAELQAQRLWDAAALKEQTAAALEADEPGSRIAQIYREQAAALRDLAQAKGEGGRKQDAADVSRKELDELNKFLDPARAQTFGEALREAFGTAGESLSRLTGALDGFGKRQAEITKHRETAEKNRGKGEFDELKYLQTISELNKRQTQDQLASYGSMANAAAGFFGEQSRGYEALMAVSKVFHAAELAMTLAELVPKGISAVLNQGTGDPYSAFGRMAAMAAIVTGLGVTIGGIGGSGPSLSESRQKAQGAGTVLGSDAKSESISKSLDLIKDATFQGLGISTNMLLALRNIESNIGSFASLLVRTDGVTGNYGSGLTKDVFDSKGVAMTGGIAGGLAGASAGAYLGMGGGKIGAILGGPLGMALGAALGALVGKTFIGKALGSVFGGKQTVEDSGFSLDKADFASILGRGINAMQYADVKTDGGWFKSDKYSTKSEQLGEEANRQISSVLKSLYGAVFQAGTMVGISADEFTSQLNGFVVDIGKISLKGLSDDEIQKELQAVFSKVGDQLAEYGVAGLQQFQKVGEGYLETLTRVATNYQAVAVVTESLGMVFVDVGTASIAARERLIDLVGGLGEFTSSAEQFMSDFYTDKERADALRARIQPTLDQFGIRAGADDTLQQFRDVVKSLKLETADGAQAFATLMQIAPAVKQIADVDASKFEERMELQKRLDELTLTAAQLREKEIEKYDESNQALLRQIFAIEDHKAALEAQAEAQRNATQAAKDRGASLLSGVDSMFSALQSVVSREKSLLEQSANAHRALSQALRSTLDSMSAAGQGIEDRQSARAQIQAALAIAKAGGVLPDADSLKGALSVLSKDASSMFATQQDYLRDFYSTQNDIAALAGLTDDALSVEEKSLKALDGILESAQQQFNALKGIDYSVLTLAQAISGFDRALGAAKADPVASAGGSIANLYQELLGRAADSAGLDYWQNAVAGGLSLDQVRKMIMEGAEFKGLRGFAVGTNYVPTNMPAMIHEGERIIPAADNRELMRRLSSPGEGNAALVAEIKALRETVAKQQTALDKIVNNTGEHKEMFDKATGGGGPMLVEIEK